MPYPEAGVDISDADAVEEDVRQGKTFYSIKPPKKTGTLVLSEHVDSEATDLGGTASASTYYCYSDSVNNGGTILSASVTLTRKCMVVVVAFVCVHGISYKCTDIKRGAVTVTKETVATGAPFAYSSGYGYLQYASEVLDAGAYTYSLVNTYGATIYAAGAVIKIVAVTV
jgi:hypothetical protein